MLVPPAEAGLIENNISDGVFIPDNYITKVVSDYAIGGGVSLRQRIILLAGQPLKIFFLRECLSPTSRWSTFGCTGASGSIEFKKGWVQIDTRKVFALALRRINEFAQLTPPTDLPIREIFLTNTSKKLNCFSTRHSKHRVDR